MSESDLSDSYTSPRQESDPLFSTGFGIFLIVWFAIVLLIICCVCGRLCFYKLCRKSPAVSATATHITVVTPTRGQYPERPSQPLPLQPSSPAQSSASLDWPHGAGPPPTYLEAVGPMYTSKPTPSSQVAFGPEPPPYPSQPVAQPQADAPPTVPDFLAQPASSPDYVVTLQTS